MNARRKVSQVREKLVTNLIGFLDPKYLMMLVGLFGVGYQGNKNTSDKVHEVKGLVDTVYVAIANGRAINARQDAKIEALERIIKRYELRATIETRKEAKLAEAQKPGLISRSISGSWGWITAPFKALTGG